ncbi:uncharacterized protein N7484_008156 [Penicillium longicatenatum]|uniref:uncharacterized protein n=1 Tax=Penicillium longicatenatum TaxID=1561947 RepID=UPI002549B63B|nr:uncharacterized protein N7484_008156 [Penicillium longicatenatum]KAJ5640294.1 hypothetical protein N7484_008156 [Penicillium longicatenatum]
MNILAIYAIAAGGFCIALFLIQTRSILINCTESFSVLLYRHLILPVVISRHRVCGPWTRAGVLVHISYIAINIALVFFRTDSLVDAGRRAGELALINTIFPLSGAHLSYIAELLGITWRTCCKIHRATGWMTVILLSFHVIAEAQSKNFSFSLVESRNLLTMIGAISIGVLALLSFPYFRGWSYEFFLRGHQLLSVTFVYGTWRHLSKHGGSAKLYIYIAVGILGLTTCLEFVMLLYRNGLFSGSGAPRALVSFTVSESETGRADVTAAQIQLILPRPIQVEPGQYINLWIPSVSIGSWMQTHPFTVTSWSRRRQDTLKLLVQPRHGFSGNLVRHGSLGVKTSISFLALFTGPHGITENTDHYETVLLVTSGFGIAASIPYLKKMIHGYNTCISHVRRLHLVWQIETIETVMAAEELLNDLLDDDVIDKGYILSISIYVEHGLAKNKTLLGKHERLCYYQGVPDYRSIVSTEASGSQIERLANIPDEPGRALVMVSANNNVRDHIRQVVKGYLHQGVQFSELEYQPD